MISKAVFDNNTIVERLASAMRNIHIEMCANLLLVHCTWLAVIESLHQTSHLVQRTSSHS